MFDTTIVISSQGTQLATDSSHFTLRSKGRRIGRIPPTMIGQMVIHAGVEVTATAFERLTTLGIPVTLLNWEGRVKARLCPPWKHDAQARIEQAKVYLDPAARLLVARRIVDAKIANSAAMLVRHAGNHPSPDLHDAAAALRQFRPKVARAADSTELFGLEGQSAAIYYSVFDRMLRAPWARFTKRSRRPPLDPVNSVLSYTYAVLANDLVALLEGNGLDPYIGFLHRVEARRPSLALDLMEPFRPLLADRLCLNLVNLGTIKPEHFMDRKPAPGIFISPEGRRAVLEAVIPWSSAVDDFLGEPSRSPRGILTREIDRFSKDARSGALADFKPSYLLPKDSLQCPDPAP